MSEVETHKGKLVPVEVVGNTLEEKIEHICKTHDWDKDEWYDTWQEVLEDNGYREYYIAKDDTIYKIDDKKVDPEGFATGEKNEDGSIDFFISWYNGGASMDEVLDGVLKDIEEDES